jgi:DNA-binding CsgD family transcriptional regulator
MTTLQRDGASRQPGGTIQDKAGEWSAPFLDRLGGSIGRGSLARTLRELCAAVSAEQFCLADLSRSHAEEPPQVLSSNWTFDAIDIIGTASIEMLHQSPFATSLAQPLRPFETGWTSRTPRVINETVALRLLEFGHGEIFLLKLRAGVRRGVCLFSTAVPGRIDRDLLARAHVICNYLMSRYCDNAAETTVDPLSERERECLLWVSEGKTTQDIAQIIGVSANTVNKYIVSSIQTFAASNRTMAIAIAIRNGVI